MDNRTYIVVQLILVQFSTFLVTKSKSFVSDSLNQFFLYGFSVILCFFAVSLFTLVGIICQVSAPKQIKHIWYLTQK